MSLVLPPQPFLVTSRSSSTNVASREVRDAAAQAWQREMERAQMTQWFPAARIRVVAPAPEVTHDGLSAGTEQHEASGLQGIGADKTVPNAHSLPPGTGSMPGQPGQFPMSRAGMPTGGLQQTESGSLTGASQTGHGIPPVGSDIVHAQAASLGAPQSERFVLPQVTRDPDVRALPVQEAAARGSLALRLQVDATEPSVDTASSNENMPSDASLSCRTESASRAARPGLTGTSLLSETTDLPLVRCHAQWSDDGVNVWLGMDARVQQPDLQLELIFSQLQQSLTWQGTVLASLTCNGRVVFQRDGRESTPLFSGSGRDSSINRMPGFSPGTGTTVFQQDNRSKT